MAGYIFKFLLAIAFSSLQLSVKSQNTQSEVIELSKFSFKDTSLPSLKPGLYLVDQPGAKDKVSKKLYTYIKSNTESVGEVYSLSVNHFLDFKNVDSIYAQKEDPPYQKYYEITLKLNSEGQRQFFNLTSNPKYYLQDVRDSGLLIGTVLNNTLISIIHVYNPINAEKICIASAITDKASVNEVIKYYKSAIIEK